MRLRRWQGQRRGQQRHLRRRLHIRPSLGQGCMGQPCQIGWELGGYVVAGCLGVVGGESFQDVEV